MGNLVSAVPPVPDHSNPQRPKMVPDEEGLAARRILTRQFIAGHVPAPDVHVHGADEDAVVFCRTVGPRQQAAVAAWAELAAADQGSGAATPPGLPVMVAAMLRRPVLEAYLDCAAKVAPGGPMPLVVPVPSSTTPNQRARLAEDPRFGADMLRTIVDVDPTAAYQGLPWNASVFDALAILDAHGDLADALLAVPLNAALHKGSVGADTDGVTPQRSTAYWQAAIIAPVNEEYRLTGGVALRDGDFRAAAAMLLTRCREPITSPHQRWTPRPRQLAALGLPAGAPVTKATDEAWALLELSCTNWSGSPDTKPEDVLAKCLAADRSLQHACRAARHHSRAGDALALMHAAGMHGGNSVPPAAYAAFLRKLPHAFGHTSDAAGAFVAAGAPDIAAAIVATAGTAATTPLTAVAATLVRFEVQRAAARHGTGRQQRHVPNEVAFLPHRELVMPLFTADDAPVLRSLGPDAPAAFGPDAHLLFAASRTAPPAGAPATTDRAECARRWKLVSGGVLDGWAFWEHTLVVGGAVAACLDPLRPLQADAAPLVRGAAVDGPPAALPSDVDIVFHSVTPDGASALCAQLQEHAHRVAAARGLCGKSTASGVAVLLTSHTMTVVFDAPELPRVQVALGHWESAADALQTADVDACCCGLTFPATNGDDALPATTPPPTVLATGRGALAWASKANVPSGQRHAVRGSPGYELRLWKYARRHGFAVLDVVHHAADERVVALLADVRTKAADSSNPKAKRRHARDAATSASGLEWLAHVDGGVITPTAAVDDVCVTDTKPLATVITAVTKAGYVQSDNYGTHEEGYVLVTDDDTPPDADAIAFDAHRYGLETADYSQDLDAVTEDVYLEEGEIPRADIRSNLLLTDQDSVDVERAHRYATRWDLAVATIESDEEDEDDDE